jgi:hypothetical protein
VESGCIRVGHDQSVKGRETYMILKQTTSYYVWYFVNWQNGVCRSVVNLHYSLCLFPIFWGNNNWRAN